MRKLLVFLVGLGWASVGVLAQEPVVETATETITETVVVSTPPIVLNSYMNTAFTPGEKFEFVIKYEFIAGGRATLESRVGPVVNERPTIEFVSNARSNKFIDVFFKVRDYNASTVDADSLATVSFHQNLREGKYKVIRTTKVDYRTRTYTYTRTYKGRTTQRSGPVDQTYSDILSAFFYARTLPLSLGESYFIDVFSDGKVYSLRLEVDKKVRKVRVPAGKFECLRVRPYVIGDGIYKAKGGKAYIWMTNDERRMPVLLRSKVFIGSFDAELKKFSVPN